MKFMKIHLFHEISLDFNGQEGPPTEVNVLKKLLRLYAFNILAKAATLVFHHTETHI
jgi:hypothetical protein